MTSIARILVLLALPAAALAQPLDPHRQPLNRGELTGYPWNETSDLVRVPKGLLRYLDFEAVRPSTYPGVPKWIVTDVFIGVFGLTPGETHALGILISQTQEALRRVEGNHLKPVVGRPPMGAHRDPEGLSVLDERSFALGPRQEALDQVEGDLRAGLLRVLGRQRADAFLSRSLFQWSFHPATTGSESFTFRLIELGSIRSIDLVRVSGGGDSGGPLFEEDDGDAPEPLKPTLKSWRASIREHQRTNRLASAGESAVRPVTGSMPPTAGIRDGGGAAVSPADRRPGSSAAAAWDEEAGYAEFSKGFIAKLGLLTIDDEELSPEAEVLFGLTSDEAKAVAGLFKEFGRRFERLEARHLSKQNAVGNRYLLNRFPDEAKALSDEWLARVKGIVGASRGELLDCCIRDEEMQARRELFGHPGRGPRSMIGWPIWPLRGRKAFRITANIQEGPDGRFSLELMELENPDGFNASCGGPVRGFPRELRHLFPMEGIEPARKPDPTPF